MQVQTTPTDVRQSWDPQKAYSRYCLHCRWSGAQQSAPVYQLNLYKAVCVQNVLLFYEKIKIKLHFITSSQYRF